MIHLKFPMKSILFLATLLILDLQSVRCLQDTSFDSSFEDDPETADIPKFVTHGQIHRAVIGDTAILPCKVDKLGPYVIIWKRGNAVLTAGEMKITLDMRISLVNGYDLAISKVRTQDGGDYTCQLSTYTPDEQIHTLEILVPPSVRSEPSTGHISITKGDSVTMHCRGSGNPVPVVTWTRRNNLLPNGLQSMNGNSYTIQKADRHQAGVYLCTASNGVGTPVSTSITVSVQYPPEIEVERNWVHSGEGYEAELACIVYSDPPATVKWFRDTLILDTDGRRLMEVRGSRHSFIIRKVQALDFGNYSCEADNKLGRSKKHIELSGRPNKAVFRSDPVGRVRDSFNVTWSVESFSPVDEFRLLYRKKHVNETHEGHEGQWHEVVLSFYTQGSMSMSRSLKSSPLNVIHWKSYNIRHLETGSIYEALISSKNKYGWSKASELFQFNTRSNSEHDYPFESSPQQDVLAESEVRDSASRRMASAASFAKNFHPFSFLLLTTIVFLT